MYTVDIIINEIDSLFILANNRIKEIKKIMNDNNLKNKEVCICAAVIAVGGTIIRGHRHRDCQEGIIRRGLKPEATWGAQGFITSKNRYVDREEGFKLQHEAGIKSANPEGYNSCGWLYSEDLY